MKPRGWDDLQRAAERRGDSGINFNPNSLPVKAIAEALVERADELGLVWHLVQATVAQPGPGGVMRVVLDGDTEPIDAVTMIGRLPVNGRVYVILSPPAGVHIVGFLGYDFPPSVSGEAIGRPRMIVCAASVESTTDVLIPVTGMSFTAVPNGLYEIRLRASIGGPVTTDAVVSWTVPTGAAMERYVLGINSGETSNYAASVMLMGRRSAGTSQASGTFSGGAAGSSDFPGYWEENLLRMGATGGTVQLQFSRLAAAGTALFRSNSYMVVQRFR